MLGTFRCFFFFSIVPFQVRQEKKKKGTDSGHIIRTLLYQAKTNTESRYPRGQEEDFRSHDPVH